MQIATNKCVGLLLLTVLVAVICLFVRPANEQVHTTENSPTGKAGENARFQIRWKSGELGEIILEALSEEGDRRDTVNPFFSGPFPESHPGHDLNRPRQFLKRCTLVKRSTTLTTPQRRLSITLANDAVLGRLLGAIAPPVRW